MTGEDHAIISALSALEYRAFHQFTIGQIFDDRVTKYVNLKNTTISKREIYRKAKKLMESRKV